MHIFGPSSKGKTTALLTAISCGGNPSRSSGLMTQWCSTQNSIYGLLRGNNGVPFGIDELSSTNESNLSDCIYTLANGTEKHRLTREASYDVERNGTWATTIISTGEKSLLSCCNKNAGLNIRVLEINAEAITPDADTAEKLTAGVKENYGHACSVLAHYLTELGRITLESRLKGWQKKLSDEFTNRDEYCNRITRKLAIIMLTAELSGEIFKLPFKIDAIETLLITSSEKQNISNPRDVFKNTMQCLISHLASHPDLYVKMVQA